MKTSTLYLIFLCAGLTISSCRCKDDDCQDPTNPDCENYDPCYGKKPTADFTLRQWDGWAVKPEDAVPEDCDTILLHGIRAQALSPVAQSYSWKIGTDDRVFTDRELRMTFLDYRNDSNNLNPENKYYYKPIPITLTVRNTESQCVAAKDTLLQHTRNLVFVSTKKPEPMIGKFVGISDFDNKEREIEISFHIVDSTFSSTYPFRYNFINFPNLDEKDSIVTKLLDRNVLRSFKYSWWDWGYIYGSSTEPFDGLQMCKIYIDPIEGQDYVRIEYRYVTKDGQVKLYHFKGKRIM